ncbi:bifunctional 5,10-methylene-tetrahydrofolate dehydrogenase/5,10-methylene-tetrahydrofolate cyclohydrolase, partial [bacterium]|nr:bifunctional 5,10-methylene-tetrahydrofolate dehydrogenase/5,10-methylene-tetrahydrofolate cyclohydrolase [bacterium]
YGINLDGLHAVVVGRSITVGRPLAWMLLRENATVTICHSHTADLERHTREADILISATGCTDLIGPDHVQKDAVVIDVGTSYLEDGTVCGDVQYDSVAPKVRMITPHIGGLGPVTTVRLLQNAVRAAELSLSSGV